MCYRERVKKTGEDSRPALLTLRLSRLEATPRASRLQAPDAREFHVSRDSRGRLGFDQALFSLSGNVVLADFQAVRVLAQKLNEARSAGAAPLRAGDLNAMGLIDEILHHVVALYAAQVRPSAMRDLLSALEKRAGAGEMRALLLEFCRQFPPLDVHAGRLSPEEYVAGEAGGQANRVTALEELILLWLANANPAFAPFHELFADERLAAGTAYARVPGLARDFFAGLPGFGPEGQNLIDMLRSPALAFPDSLAGQLRYMRERWGLLLGRFLERLLVAGDLIREDEKAFPPGPGPAQVFDARLADGQARPDGGGDGERFTPDRDWMPRLVLMAKSVYVWLDQLSRATGRAINTLDAIPDEELDRLARWGFTGLWLIGVWERSPASRRIKQACGNPEAMASAYSLYRYEIAADLGGEAALENLRARAWARGIRLASDMVPNHMGIDSPWVIEHPEWFVQLDHSPFPAYRFTGEDLSGDPRVAIRLEDHYYDRSDAAVVFQWTDRRSGRVRYIYHGNDGTRMPWNDTAQLNYLRADVREAVMQSILEVARKFPIVRFDAAMTLTRSHYQRLWFPPPGAGGDIPSRAGLGLTPEQFQRVMPWEFWREVVDRMARENPDTLLLAEAFWLMESYFVRTLGMHRVYNSAFMNFLKMEENAKFRQSLKNALEFNPEILRRYVNFMNNPDEETAWAQFGGGDKYFGACTLLAALPGLPMFGHGQVEGFREKYGMEYRRAYWQESADLELVERHERQIFPLLRWRDMLAGVEEFRLYDFFTDEGRVDENVIAFSNGDRERRCLVAFHNRFASTAGWIRLSAAFAAEDPFGGPRVLTRESLGQGLGLSGGPGLYAVLRDQVSGLEYLHPSQDLCSRGLHLELGAYQTVVFMEIGEVADGGDGRLARLAARLQGRGVPSLLDAAREMDLAPLHEALRSLCALEPAASFLEAVRTAPGGIEENSLWLEYEGKARLVGEAAAGGEEGRRIAEAILDALGACRRAALSQPGGGWARAQEGTAAAPAASAAGLKPQAENGGEGGVTPLAVREGLCRRLLRAALLAISAGSPRRWDEMGLDGAVAAAMAAWGEGQGEIILTARLFRFFSLEQGRTRAAARECAKEGESAARALAGLVEAILSEEPVRDFLQVNAYAGEEYFNQERFSRLAAWLREEMEGEMTAADCQDGPGAEEARILLAFLPILALECRYEVKRFQSILKEFQKK